MPRLDSDELDDLTKRIQHELSETAYACSALEALAGGTTSFVFRGSLRVPILPDGDANRHPIRSVIIKHATAFASCNRDFLIDDSRATVEYLTLRALRDFPVRTSLASILVDVPQVYYYNEIPRIQVMQDLAPVSSLETLLSADTSHDPRNIGAAIGTWLRGFHEWAWKPQQLDLRNAIAAKCRPMRNLKRNITYDSAPSILERFPRLLEQRGEMLAQVVQMAHVEFSQDGEVGKTDGALGIIHGDLWTGNILMRTDNAAPHGSEHLHVIDWEFAQYGHRAYDLGQFIGNLLETKHFTPAQSIDDLLDGFLAGYGVVSEAMASRTAIHVGIHMMNWCSRHPWPKGDELVHVEGLVREALDLIAQGWAQDTQWFETSPLEYLFRRDQG